MTERKRWSRNELLVAMNVYGKLSFGQFDQRNPVVKDVARMLERTPSSVAMKLSNLASLDPALRARGIKGLKGASSLDNEIWVEFHENQEQLAAISEELFRQLFSAKDSDDVELIKGVGVKLERRRYPAPPIGPTEKSTSVLVRRGQQFFRQMILNAFDGRCCVTGIGIRELLIASHIKPWGRFPELRLDVQNGLCLSRLHDAAFDRGLISFDDDCRLMLSRKVKKHLPQAAIEQNFVAYEGVRIQVPEDALGPNMEFLSFHREVVFHG